MLASKAEASSGVVSLVSSSDSCSESDTDFDSPYRSDVELIDLGNEEEE